MTSKQRLYDAFRDFPVKATGEVMRRLDVASIMVSDGREVLVDVPDLLLIDPLKIRISNDGYASYKGKPLHRLLLGLTDRNICVDHINHNKLDNRRLNLRTCTQVQNGWNKPIRHADPRGVYVKTFPQGKRFVVRLWVNKKMLEWGPFDTQEEAARMHDVKAVEYRGEFANLNYQKAV